MKRHLQNERKYLQMMRLTRGLFLKYTNSSYLKNNPKGKKKGRKLNIFLQRRHADDQEAYEKMLNITNY